MRPLALIALLVFAGCRTMQVPPGGERQYIVQKGNTLTGIASRHGVSVEAIAKRNNITNPKALGIGDKLVIPPIETVTERPSEVEPEPPEVPVEDAKREVVDPNAPLTWSEEKGTRPVIWPVDGVVVSGFGKREGVQHDGIDIAAPIGTAIWAVADGDVVYSGEQKGYGTIVIVAHADGMVTIYAHNAQNVVKDKEKVKQGQPIARVGETGGATSPGVHFEIRIKNKPIDPLPKLP